MLEMHAARIAALMFSPNKQKTQKNTGQEKGLVHVPNYGTYFRMTLAPRKVGAPRVAAEPSERVRTEAYKET